MRGKGMPVLRRNANGDQIVEIQVETPTNLTKKQKELLQTFSEVETTVRKPLAFLTE